MEPRLCRPKTSQRRRAHDCYGKSFRSNSSLTHKDDQIEHIIAYISYGMLNSGPNSISANVPFHNEFFPFSRNFICRSDFTYPTATKDAHNFILVMDMITSRGPRLHGKDMKSFDFRERPKISYPTPAIGVYGD